MEVEYRAKGWPERPHSQLAKMRRKLVAAQKRKARAWRDLTKLQNQAARLQQQISDPEEALLTNNIPYIGELLYTDFLFPFEVVSMILLVALIGVVVLVKRETVEQVLNIQEETQAKEKGQESA